MLQDLVYPPRQALKLACQFTLAVGRQAVASRERHDQQKQARQLGGKRLGGGDPDLRPGAGQEYQFGRARQRAFRDIADRERA